MKVREESDKRAGALPPGALGLRRRAALLAKIHIAAKDLGIPAADYRALLMGEFGVPSAADLSLEQMERLVEYFARRGWRPRGRGDRGASLAARRRSRRVFALQSRAREMFSRLEDSDERRLRGLCEKICGSPDLASCRDPEKLRRILAVLGRLGRRESGSGRFLH